MLRQAFADIAAPGNHHAAEVPLHLAQLAHHRADIPAGRQEKHLVVGFNHRVAPGNDRPVAAINRRHAGFHVGHMLAQKGQILAHQRAAVEGFHCHQLH